MRYCEAIMCKNHCYNNSSKILVCNNFTDEETFIDENGMCSMLLIDESEPRNSL